jgi:hypothetical protein
MAPSAARRRSGWGRELSLDLRPSPRLFPAGRATPYVIAMLSNPTTLEETQQWRNR